MEMETPTKEITAVPPHNEIKPSIGKVLVLKRTLIMIIGVVILVSLVGSSAYYLGKKQNQPYQQQNSIMPSPTSQARKPTTNPTVNLLLADIKTLKGKLLYRLNDQIVVSNLDGSNAMKLVDSNNKTGYAGWSDGGRVVYYTELVGTTSTLYKKDLATGTVTKLFDYDSKEKNIETHFLNVNVSSDGKFAVYSHAHGNLSLYDLTNNTTKLLLARKECLSYNNSNNVSLIKPVYAGVAECYGYYYPYWSPNNQRVVIRKIFYEGATQVVVNPFTNPATEKDVKTGGSPPEWSSDSSKIVIPGAGYGSGSLYLISTPDNPINKDLLADNSDFKDSAVTSSALSNDGKIAFTYSNYGQNKNGIALYDLNTNSIKPLMNLSNGDNSYVQLWTDNSNLLYKDGESIWSLNVNTLSKTQLPITATALIEVVQ